MTFNTIEDINGTQFDNQGFWWYKVDLSKITTGTEDYSDVKVDFCSISRTKLSNGKYQFTVVVDNSLWSNAFYLRRSNGDYISYGDVSFNRNNFPLKFTVDYSDVILQLYMGVLKTDSILYIQDYIVGGDEVNVTYDMLNKPYSVTIRIIDDPSHIWDSVITINSLTFGFHLIARSFNTLAGYLFVQLVKTDFQFDCSQQLVVGEVNTVRLGTETDYKPNGALVGEYATKLSVLYNDKTIPVNWNAQLNDYTFDLDLTNVTEEKKIRFKVIVEANEVLNASETDVALDCKFETIDTLAKLTNLFRIGGTGRLSSDLRLTSDLTVSKSVNLIGNNYQIDLDQHKIIVPTGRTFKSQTTKFYDGINTIQQYPGSTVELTECHFLYCYGFGSCIDCQVDIDSLSDETDFKTIITNCIFEGGSMMILHGGDLTVTGCTVIGEISNKNYPYFLYQTDGNATILNSQFNLRDNIVFEYDIEFNSCIFTCGETATVNGYSHSELQNNNLTAFFDTQRNTSTIDVQYYYSLIEDIVHLQSSKGFCHSVSGVDYVYKTNINLSRGD